MIYVNPPKIEVCVEGYNIEQTDFYISQLIDKYNICNELYAKSLEKISLLEIENEKLRNNIVDLSKKCGENEINFKIINRLKNIEAFFGIKDEESDKVKFKQDDIDTKENTFSKSQNIQFEENLKSLRTLLNTEIV